MPIQNILITASINSLVSESYGQRTYIASTDEQSFPIETITGSYAGAWPDFVPRNLTSTNSASNTTTGLVVNVTQSWPESIVTPLGIISRIHNTMEEFVNGEFSGSNYTVSDGNVTDEDCRSILRVSGIAYIQRLFSDPLADGINTFNNTYSSSYIDGVYQGDQLADFMNNPVGGGAGSNAIYIKEDYITSTLTYVKTIEQIKIKKQDRTFTDFTLSLQELKKFTWVDPIIGIITLEPYYIQEFLNLYLYKVNTKILPIGGNTYSSTWDNAVIDDRRSEVGLEPLVLSGVFTNGDCDVTMNNVDDYEPSSTRQRVLYNNGSAVPSNLNQIINGTAEPAEVNDYLFNASDSTLPRYLGVRSTSPDFNQNTTEGGYRNLPNVESLQTYFAISNKLFSTSPLLVGKTAAEVRYLIDKNETIQTPSISSSYYWNLIYNYPDNSNSEITVLDEENNKQDLGTFSIFKAGMYPELILGNLDTPGNFKNFIRLYNSEYKIPDYYSVIYLKPGNQIINSGEDITIQFKRVTTPNDIINFDISYAAFNFLLQDDSATVILGVVLAANPTTYTIYLEQSEDLVNWSTFASQPSALSHTFIIPSSTKYHYRFRIFNSGGAPLTLTSGGTVIEMFSNIFYTENKIFSTASSAAGIGVLGYPEIGPKTGYLESNDTYGPYWMTGSNSKNIVTSSVFYRYYDPANPFFQRRYINSQYEIKEPFIINNNDVITFDQYKSFFIKNVIAEEIIDGGIIDTNFTNWGVIGTAWTTGDNFASCFGGTNPASNYIVKSFTGAINPGNLIWVQFDISDWSPVPNNALGFKNRLGIGIQTNVVIAGTQNQYFQLMPIRNGRNYVILKVPSPFTPPYDLYFTSDVDFRGTISNLKVKKMNNSDAKLYLELDGNVPNGLNLNNFTISRFKSNQNYIILNNEIISDNIGFITPQNITEDIKQNFDKIITNIQEKGLI